MNGSVKKVAFTAVLLIFAVMAPFFARAAADSGVATSYEPAPVILIQNATILTVSHGTIEHGSILIKDGKIAEVGDSVKVPKDAQVIDAGEGGWQSGSELRDFADRRATGEERDWRALDPRRDQDDEA